MPVVHCVSGGRPAFLGGRSTRRRLSVSVISCPTRNSTPINLDQGNVRHLSTLHFSIGTFPGKKICGMHEI